MNQILEFFILALFLFGCSHSAPSPDTPVQSVSQKSLGQEITVIGNAVNRKMGAQIMGEGFDVWIDGLNAWPDDYVGMGNLGKKVRVRGILSDDHTLPVFVPIEGEPMGQGIPVPEGTNMKEVSHRYVLKKASWELIGQ